MTLNNKIKTKLHLSNININNINEIHPLNIKEINKNILEIPQEYAIAHCISADLKMNKGLAAQICKKYGRHHDSFSNRIINIGDVIPIITENRLILYLITKQYYYQKPQYNDIQTAISNLIKELYKLKQYKLAIPKLATGLDKYNWSTIKQLIFSKFSNTNIELVICDHDYPQLSNNYNTHPIEKDVSNINNDKNNKNDYQTEIKSNIEHINNKFYDYKPGENVPSDGNCGIYAICNALNDNKTNNITTIADLLDLLNLSMLPNYWWSDDELASIANYYNHDTYIYNDTNKTGIIYGTKDRQSIMLYYVNNSHWIPGTKTLKPTNKIPKKYVHIENITPLKDVIDKLHLNSNKYNITQNNSNTNNHDNTIICADKNDSYTLNNINDKQENNIKQKIADNEGTLFSISPDLNITQHNQVVKLLTEFKHIFITDASKLKPANITPCTIKLKNNYSEPKFNAPHRVSPQQREELKIQIDKLLEAGIVKPIISKFAAPAFLVKKKDKGTFRLVVSYKELNDKVECDQYPIPRTTDLLRALEGSQFFSSLDLNNGFFQIPVREEDQFKLAFTSALGLMTFTRLPQGFKNSSAIFQRKLNNAFAHLLYKSLIIYIDDLASYGKTFDQALINLRETFKIIDEKNFSLKTKKCNFFYNTIELLGHKISINGIQPLNTNTKAIIEFNTPKNIKDLRSFIGMCSYYRKHIKDFAKIANPLMELIKKGLNKITWLDEHEKSFNLLKKYLTSEPLIAHFNNEKHVFLTIDASIMGLGAYIEQYDENNILHPIGYASRKLLNSEKTYSSTTLELLGLCFGITYFREYLWGRKFTVFCDNISLQYYNNLKIPSARIARLTLKLLDYDFNIIYKKGKENKVADALSRNAINNINNIPNLTDNNENLTDPYDIKREQGKDAFCTDIIKALNNVEVATNIQRKSRQFTIENNLLYYKQFNPPKGYTPILVIPKSLTTDIMKSYHDSPTAGHTGISRTIHKIKNKYYWPTLNKDTINFIKSCHSCQINKRLNGKPIGQLNPIPLSERPLDRLTFDYLGPLTTSNNKKYILVAACNNTKYIFTKAVQSATAQSTVNFIIQIISQWGCFRQLSSDRGTHFKNTLVSDVCENLGIKQILSTAYSPQTQGFVEKINDVLCNSIKNYIDNDNQHRWSYYLPYITLSYNATPQTSTKYSPFYLMHGFEPYFPIDNKIISNSLPYDIKKSLIELNKIRNKIPLTIKNIQNKQSKYHDKSHQMITFNPGDSVLIKFPFNESGKSPKLASRYRGPFKIIKKINDLNYQVQLKLNNKITTDVIHIRRMKPYIHR
jgi:O-acetyl-ADP-ribose deacetylase (regulator of RNase III)